ncbi:recombination protein recr [Mycoplasmopsis columbina SF7]|uniref:Recombination protein RecR n=1 Tax=Mycoplasmopsis columbina SF7 TaxID=1037410 RepID=F9UK87_9BACT|nr:toprim domain-containing protein [Mycoplasmopsis columbina]EGV00092.1 recombination protein recr [Mycoplasmopsis columbina SF7]
MQIETIESLNKKLTSLPGISKKQAEKISNFLMQVDKEYLDDLIEHFMSLKKRISFCSKCNFIEEDNKCLSCYENKEKNLMIVESPAIVKKISNMDFFKGYFYVLPSLVTIKAQLKDELDLDFSHLLNFIRDKNINEVIIVLSPTIDGEITTNYLMNKLDEEKIKNSRAAIGMPMNSNIDYLDTFTIKQSIENRNNKK